jgi:hypothetical protein
VELTFGNAIVWTVPATIGIAQGELIGVTKNRRAKISPFLNTTTIDPLYTVISLDNAATKAPISTIHKLSGIKRRRRRKRKKKKKKKKKTAIPKQTYS